MYSISTDYSADTGNPFPYIERISNAGFSHLHWCHEWLDKFKNRLLSIHIHDNDGEKDLHQIPFTGTVDWKRLSKLLSKSSYKKCVSLEVSMRNMGINDENIFLAQSFNSAEKLSDMI